MSRLFISHSSADQIIAESLEKWLVDQGHTAYFLDFDAGAGIAAGKFWEEELYRQLRLCRSVIALLTPGWLESNWCFAEVTHARAAGKPVFIVKAVPCDTKEVFSDVQHVDLTLNPEDGYRRLAIGLNEVGIKPGDAFEWDTSRCPYPGLLAFEKEDPAVFFGRDNEIQKGLETLDGLRLTGGPKFILCLGGSGSGKSSLMRAGLIPRLRKNSASWLPLEPCRPQEDPMEELAIELARSFEMMGEQRDWRALYEQLYAPCTSTDWSSSPNSQQVSGQGLKDLTRDLRVLAGQHEATVLLAIDQAEELFGYSDTSRSRAYLQCLRGALKGGDRRLMAIATMRSDSLVSFQMHPDIQGIAYEPFTVAPIPLRELPQIIEGPAHLADITLEPGLVQTLVHDATTSDALPLLAFTLRELYEKYGQDKQLTVAEYEELGRLEGSIRHSADTVIQTIKPSHEELMAFRVALVPAMVRINKEGNFTRRRASWLELPVLAQPLLERFVDARLLISRDVDGEQIVEIAHEALLRVWPRLNVWLNEDKDNLQILDELRDTANLWLTNDRLESWLLHSGDRLEAVEEMARLPQFSDPLDQNAKDYLEACKTRKKQEQERNEREKLAERKRLEAEAETARRKRLSVIAFTIFAVLVSGALVYGWQQTEVADWERNQAMISQSKALSLDSRQKTDEGFATLGILLSLEALTETELTNRPSVPDAEASLLYALLAQREKKILRSPSDGINAVRFSPRGGVIATASRDHTARLWNAKTGDLVDTLKGHEGQVNGIEFSPNGQSVVTVSSDSTARLWDVETRVMQHKLAGHYGNVYQASFSSDGKRLVTASEDNSAILWSTSTGEKIHSLTGHTGAVYSASFSPSDAFIVTASQDETVKLWDAITGELITTLSGHDGPVYQASFSPDGKRIATASWDHTARLWNWSGLSAEIIEILVGHLEGVENALFSPNGSVLITTSADNTPRLWDGNTGVPLGQLKGHQGQVYSAAFSTDGEKLVTTSDDGTARVWDIASRNSLAVLSGHDGPVWSASFSNDSLELATVSEDSTVRIWNASAKGGASALKGHEGYVYKSLFSSDGRLIATVSQDRSVRIWDTDTETVLSVLNGHEGEVWDASFTPDGSRLVTASNDSTVKLWDSHSGSLLKTFKGHRGWVGHVEFSPDGSTILTASEDNTARIWDVDSGATLLILHGHTDVVKSARFSHDGTLIVTASDDHTTRIWDANTGETVSILEGHTKGVAYAEFSSDDSKVVTASRDGNARLWITASGEQIAVLQGHKGQVWTAKFSADDRHIITTSWDNTARIWNTAEGKSLSTLRGHKGRVADGSFSPNGKLAVTASWDGLVLLWHVQSGQLVGSLSGHQNYVASVAFSPSGQEVVSASWDQTAGLWKLPIDVSDDWIRYAKATVPRQLTEEERQLYLVE